MSTVKPIEEHETEGLQLSERSYRRLRDMAITYGFRPGERLNEGELARKLEVSRTPLREAMHRLASEGLLVFLAGRGFHARPLEVEAVHDLYEVRRALETAIVALACERATPQWRADIRAYIQHSMAAQETAAPEELLALDEGFHERLADAAGNAEFARMLGNVNARIYFFRWVDMRGRRDTTQAEHKALAEAICAGDAPRAEEIARAHITRRRDQIVGVVREGYGLLYSGSGPDVGSMRPAGAEQGDAR